MDRRTSEVPFCSGGEVQAFSRSIHSYTDCSPIISDCIAQVALETGLYGLNSFSRAFVSHSGAVRSVVPTGKESLAALFRR
jgi:hypothetical protein